MTLSAINHKDSSRLTVQLEEFNIKKN